MTTEQVFWWQDVLVAHLTGKRVWRGDMPEAADEINARFEWDDVNQRWRGKKSVN